MTFTRFVEVGRVVLINHGPDNGKLATIIDIIDSKRVLVDGPQSITGIHRQVISLKKLSLTDVVVSNLSRGTPQGELVQGWKDQDTLAKWESTSWAKKLAAKKRRASLTDFDRFKVVLLKKQKSKLIAEKVNAIKF
eukprot:gene18660-24405_t